MTANPRLPLQTIISSAVDATGAVAGWILAVNDAELVIVAAAGGDPRWAASLLDRRASLDSGTASFVIRSGQPVALQPGTGSMNDELGTELLGRVPSSLVCVPCTADEQPLGALQLVDKFGGGPFSFDDVEVATLVGTIAGAVLTEDAGGPQTVPPPERLASALANLSKVNPGRYAAVALALEALLA